MLQQNFISYAKQFAQKNHIHIWLGGSFSKGTETPFSDIDLYLKTDNLQAVRDFIYGYNSRPVYISATANPKGILVVIYENGIALDLEIICTDYSENTDYFHIGGVKQLSAEINDEIACRLIFSDNVMYSLARLFHRSLIKYLSGKKDAGISVLEEIAHALQINTSSDNYKNNLLFVLSEFENRYSLPGDYKKELERLIKYI